MTAVLLLLSLAVWTNRQYIADSIQYWRYEPTAAVQSIVDKVAFSDKGTFLFYASHPTLDGSQKFNESCSRKEQHTAILGCYANNRIYLYDITDEQLKGIKEVTAAHEMLHAVYVRLSTTERERIDGLLEKEYQKLAAQEGYEERMAFYARTQPGERQNELHSIIGTEVAEIGSELEAHYARYFADRKNVIALHDSYSAVFRQLEKDASVIRQQLEVIEEERRIAIASYSQALDEIEAEIDAFNARAQRGGFASPAVFNRERSALVARTAELESQRVRINQMVIDYNELVIRYNNTVVRSQDLYKSIDSSLAPIPAI